MKFKPWGTNFIPQSAFRNPKSTILFTIHLFTFSPNPESRAMNPN